MDQSNLIWAMLVKVRADDLNALLEKLEDLPRQETIIELQTKVEGLQERVTQLKHKLQIEKADNQLAVKKMNNSLKVIKKIEDYIWHQADVLSKARVFDEVLAKNLASAVKVILILVDFNQKIEELLDDMRSLFDRLNAQQALPLGAVLNISINSKEILLLQG